MAYYEVTEKFLERNGYQSQEYDFGVNLQRPSVGEYSTITYRHIGADRFYYIGVQDGIILVTIFGERDSKISYEIGLRYKIEFSWDKESFYQGCDEQEYLQDLEKAIPKREMKING